MPLSTIGGKRGRVMDKLVEHAIRMLEIVEGENDFFRNDAKRQADIARAVYDTILRVQVLERKADRKTEPIADNLSAVETMSCQECKNYERCSAEDWRSCRYEPKTEPHTERSE